MHLRLARLQDKWKIPKNQSPLFKTCHLEPTDRLRETKRTILYHCKNNSKREKENADKKQAHQSSQTPLNMV
jgi:hypothetical protein